MHGGWALITGATSGIGEACAIQLAARGVNLILTGRRDERLRALSSKLKEFSVDVRTLAFDISDSERLEKSLTGVKSELEKLDVLINNAGLAVGTLPMKDSDPSDWDQMIDTNVRGLLKITRFCLPFMVARGRGHIVNMGSVAGRWVYPGGGVYCATKFAVRAITEGLRMDLMGTGVRVTNIEPGMVETEFSQVRFSGDVEKAKAVYKGMTPLKAKDIAEAIVWSLDRPAHVNIQEMVIYPTDQAGIGPFVHRRS